jgi:hypothetical protein
MLKLGNLMKITHIFVFVFVLAVLVSVSSLELASAKTFATKLNISSLEIKNTSNETTAIASTNQQLIISGIMSGLTTNNRYAGLPYIAICEIRDADGVTIYLETQRGTLDENEQAAIDFLWQPRMPGNYEIRGIGISDFDNPELLTHLDVLQTKVADWGGILDPLTKG